MNRKYSPEMRERALRMLAETRPSHPTMMSAVRHVAGLLGMSPETLRLWQRRYEVDAGVKPGLTTDAAAEIKRLQELWTSSSSAVIVTHDAIIRPVIDHLDRGRQLSVPTASWCVMVAGTSGWEVVDVDQVAPGREP
ncbi:transposase [Microbacterium sp. 69-10]|uniref:transposase n=1 Tax=Microbacterium sp. 69-10 TaxID=1895783 RepID=UPI0025CF8E4F|nr:transposase [Microbacterium sp. 69-10]